VQVLTRAELTAALAARQMLIERKPLAPAEAIGRLTPLQGQESPAPFVALAARLDGFNRNQLEAAIDSRDVVKTSIMRMTLHLAAGADFPAYAQFTRQPRMRKWRPTYAHLDEEGVVGDLTAWFDEPRTNTEIRQRVSRYDGVTPDMWTPVIFARTLLPLVQVPPSGHWKAIRQPQFVVDPRPLPTPAEAATRVLTRYLEAFGPASRRDIASWSGVPQRDFAGALASLPTVSYHDEEGRELLDLPGLPLPPASTPLPPRFLASWDQALLAYADRDRIIPPAVQPLRLTLSGDCTLTVDGRVAASWKVKDGLLTLNPHVEIPRAARAGIREEALRTARFIAPDADHHEVTGL